MFNKFIDSITDFGKMLKGVTDTDQEFTESYLQGSWNNKLSTVFKVFYQYYLSTKALISESEDKYEVAIDKLEKKNPIPNFTSPSGLWARGFADYFYDADRNIEIFEKFILLNYDAPSDPVELLEHLFSLYFYYMQFRPATLPFEFAFQIENVKTQLIAEASKAIILHEIARNEYLRISKSTKTITKNAEDREQAILEEYYKVKDRANLNDHKIAKAIQKQMEDFGKKPLALNTIKKYFRKGGVIEK